jgi:hypothetical protein
MILNSHEITQFQFILPAQGDIKTLELVESILNRLESIDRKEIVQKDIEIEFLNEEISLMKSMINYLDKNKQLSLQSLSLVKKILINGA